MIRLLNTEGALLAYRSVILLDCYLLCVSHLHPFDLLSNCHFEILVVMVTKMLVLQLPSPATFGQPMPKTARWLSMKMPWSVFCWIAWYAVYE